jgi:hypothetical protein
MTAGHEPRTGRQPRERKAGLDDGTLKASEGNDCDGLLTKVTSGREREGVLTAARGKTCRRESPGGDRVGAAANHRSVGNGLSHGAKALRAGRRNVALVGNCQ